MTSSARRMPVKALAVFLGLLLATAGCGGGGSNGVQSVTFLGFSFRSPDGVVSTVPPVEDLGGIPPSLGAPLNVVVIFEFTGVPTGPFDSTTLPVFTTSQDVTPAALAPSGQTILAKGTYALIAGGADGGTSTVEFTPFVPTAALSIKLSSPPGSVPGLLPASTYTARVSTTPGAKINNLSGAGGTVQFGTTSNPSFYYPSPSGPTPAPAVVLTAPVDGATNFFPNPFDNTPLGTPFETFPSGIDSFLLTYDTPVAPTASNLHGSDLDGDGFKDPSFYLLSRATEIVVGLEVPAASTVGNTDAFPAFAGLSETQVVAADGSDLFLHDSQGAGALPGGDSQVLGVPASLAPARDSSLFFTLFKDAEEGGGGGDRLAVIDHILGDPSFADVSDAVVVPGTDLVGLAAMLDGRLVAYDRTTRRIVEVLTTVDRLRPVGEPILTSVTLGDGVDGFLSAVQDPSIEILDLAQSPSGDLFALAEFPTGAEFPSIVKLIGIDDDMNGVFAPSEGLFLDLVGAVVVLTTEAYSDMSFVSATEVLALNRTTDAVDLIDLETGLSSPVITDVGAYGVPLASFPDGLSPATTLAVGLAEYDVRVSLEANAPPGALVRLEPTGVLPDGKNVAVMQRNVFSSLAGVNASNSNPLVAVHPLGASEVLSVRTSDPEFGTGTASPGAPISDVFLEVFDDSTYEDPDSGSISPIAEWAAKENGATSNGTLRASVGVSEVAQLGDFLPATPAGFDANIGFERGLTAIAGFSFLFLDTDAQAFPLPDGSTPGVTSPVLVTGGKFTFRDFIIPEGVWVIATGSNPLRITATGRIEIAGLLDLSGTDGLGDDTFDTGFIPVPGGAGGPGGGRGGASHPTRFDPAGPGTLNQYVTPERGERGFGPVINANGTVTMQQVGGWGGLSTAGYDPKSPNDPTAGQHNYPKIPNTNNNTEHHRPGGGGGGSFYARGIRGHDGAGDYRVQSESTWFPFTKCPTNNKIDDATYGNDENLAQGLIPSTPTQCVYRTYQVTQPGAKPGNELFVDGDPSNDFIGPGGEVPLLIGGQGGGGGASRIDSMNHAVWSSSATPWLGTPLPPGPGVPPFFPSLVIGTFHAPTLFDAKGGGGGGGGGSALLRAFGDILITETGHIDASGGEGNGGEVVQNSTFAGGGGGGSGGAVILQSGGEIVIRGEATHVTPWWDDVDGSRGAAIEVSGGVGFDARTQATQTFSKQSFTYDVTRGDGGQGGFGLIQLQEGSVDGKPLIEQGAYLFAGVRGIGKLGPWTSEQEVPFSAKQADHPIWNNPPATLPDSLRYIDMLHYRPHKYDVFKDEPNNGQVTDYFLVLQGSFPPIIEEDAEGAISPFQLDTEMFYYAPLGRNLVHERQPDRVFKEYFGWDPTTFEEIEDLDGVPGVLWDEDEHGLLPFNYLLNEPDGTPLMVDLNGQPVFDPNNVIDRLPVVTPGITPPPFGSASRGTSRWLDFNGVAVRMRDAGGVAPPFFDAGVNGTYNALLGVVDPDLEGRVIASVSVPGQPAAYQSNTPGAPFDPGLFGGGSPPDPPYNDIKVDAPELSLENALTDNASVRLVFQGAYPVRAGSSVPDPSTTTDWIADLRALSGYPLVRFQVIFDLSADADNFPFGVDSFRPAVDYERMRVGY